MNPAYQTPQPFLYIISLDVLVLCIKPYRETYNIIEYRAIRTLANENKEISSEKFKVKAKIDI